VRKFFSWRKITKSGSHKMKVGAKLVIFFKLCKKNAKKMHTTNKVFRFVKANRLYSE